MYECKLVLSLVATKENSMEVSQKTVNRIALRSSNPTPRHIYLDKTIIQKMACISMLIAALFTIAKTWKQPNAHQQMSG